MPHFNSMQSPYAYAVESGAGWSLRRHLRQTPQAAISFQACRQPVDALKVCTGWRVSLAVLLCPLNSSLACAGV